jgi:hypothetical protein
VADVADPDFVATTMLTELPFVCSPFDTDKTADEQLGCLTGLLEQIGEDYGRFNNPAQVEIETFSWLRTVYPTAGLDNFEVVETDWAAAMVAVMLHHDYTESALSLRARKLIKTSAWFRRAVEAGYNSHVDHVSRSIETYGSGWRKSGHGLPTKTQTLLRKFIWIEENLGRVKAASFSARCASIVSGLAPTARSTSFVRAFSF